jgi:hypothetical protein
MLPRRCQNFGPSVVRSAPKQKTIPKGGEAERKEKVFSSFLIVKLFLFFAASLLRMLLFV